jgi:hypothetical protein
MGCGDSGDPANDADISADDADGPVDDADISVDDADDPVDDADSPVHDADNPVHDADNPVQDSDISPSCLPETPVESFDAEDEPFSVNVDGHSVSVTTPWGYDRDENASRQYPIVVNGMWGEGWAFNTSVRQEFPAFFLEYQYDTETAGADLSDLIDDAIEQGLRIDTDRIYLTGFSRGGSGSFDLIRGFLSRGKLFAGLIRIAGGSEWVLPDEAVESTSIWYHIGHLDEPARVAGATTTYNNIRDHSSNASATESTVEDTVTSGGVTYERTTRTLTKNSIEIMKLSEYPTMGHVNGPPYADPQIFAWLFSQSLLCR